MVTELAQSKYKMMLPSSGLHHKLLGWFDLAKREMPWRETRDPYAIWLSETMLQQTQVETVKPYYRKFLERFPTVADLARAELEEVLAMWAGLGYYRRAKHLHLAAREMVAKHGGKVPGSFESLVSLPGVGRYTAGAVGSIAFGLPVAVVDGNVMRVVARLTGFDGDVADPKNAGFFWGVMEGILAGLRGESEGRAGGGKGSKQGVMKGHSGAERGRLGRKSARWEEESEGFGRVREEVEGALAPRYGDLNQAVMELGATVCTPPPSVPACLVCPVRAWYRACAGGRVMELPVKRKKGETPVVRGVAVVVVRSQERGVGSQKEEREKQESRIKNQEVLLVKRPMGGVWEGMWEFPVVAGGGSGEEGDALRRGEGGHGV
ncbi:MAG: A/G-specific adenine glycosylase, partial [Phycisphaerae bacterium]